MASIYKVKKKKGEVHIYHNRVPRKDGSEPILGWTIVAVIFFAIRSVPFLLGLLAALLLEGGFTALVTLVRLNLAAVAADRFVLVLLGVYICGQFSKRIFAPQEKLVYAGFLFFRRKLARFADIDQIELSQQEIQGKVRCSYVATWRNDRIKAPIRLSPKTKSLNQLSRYYHTVVPLLQSMLPARENRAEEDEEAVDEVGVETVEVPLDEADDYLTPPPSAAPVDHRKRGSEGEGVAASRRTAARPDGPRPKGTRTGVKGREAGGPRKKGKGKGKPVFKEKNGQYTVSQSGTAIIGVLGLAAAMFGIGYFYTLVFPNNPLWVSYGIQAVIFIMSLRQLARESIRLTLDPEERTIEFTTGFGLAKNMYDFDALTKFTIKRQLGFKTLCMVLQGQTVDPSFINTRSDAVIQSALDEVCGIMGLDPEQWLAE